MRIPHLRDAKIRNEDIRWAFERADNLFNKTESTLISNLSPLEKIQQVPSHFWAIHTASDDLARIKSFPAFVSLFATKRISRSTGAVPNDVHAELKAICPRDGVQYCENKKYRSLDGSCNNVANPAWGASHSPLQRLVEADYGDSVSSLRSSKIPGESLPNVRFLSLSLFREPFEKQEHLTSLVTYWGHFVYTDLVHIGQAQLLTEEGNFAVPCCKDAPIRHPECSPIKIPKGDPRLGNFVDCMPYTRSIITPKEGCPLGKREQANLATSFLDASNIYGSSLKKMNQLRSFRDGNYINKFL